MRDSMFLALDDNQSLVISSDNLSSIGELEGDEIHVSNRVVAESLFRVTFMECVAVGGLPQAAVLYNFSDEQAWSPMIQAIHASAEALDISLSITGSTESNFPLPISSFGLTMLGTIQPGKEKVACTPKTAKWAVIGKPLVGKQVLEESENLAPLPLFKQMCGLTSVYEVCPVGSKGIGHELKEVLSENNLKTTSVKTDLDLNQSAGPSTCFIISYQADAEEQVRALARCYFHAVQLDIE